MSTPKNSKAYPALYVEIAEKLCAFPDQPVEIHFETVGKARQFRLRFCAYRNCLIREKEEMFLEVIQAVRVCVDKDSCTVRIEHVNYTAEAAAIRKALGDWKVVEEDPHGIAEVRKAIKEAGHD